MLPERTAQCHRNACTRKQSLGLPLLSAIPLLALERFYITYNQEEGKQFEVRGRHGRKRAKADLEAACRRYGRRASK